MKHVVTTDKAPAGPAGLYSQAVKAGGFLYISGQLPIDMASGEQEGADIKRAVTLCLNNVLAIAEAAGCKKDQLIKLTMFMTDLDQFAMANEAYAAFFAGIAPPARSAFQVARLPKDAIVEIEAIAAI